jgi:hypothetical protein
MQAVKLGTSPPMDEAVFAAVQHFVQQALADGCNPVDLSCALAALTLGIALENRMTLSQLAAKAIPAQGARKRKSDRDCRRSNVAERHRSSASRDVSALQAAFRQCHSDSGFRARFIAHCRNPGGRAR